MLIHIRKLDIYLFTVKMNKNKIDPNPPPKIVSGPEDAN